MRRTLIFSRRAVVELVVCLMPVLFFQLPAHATQSVELAWIPSSSSSNVVGCIIYYGTASLDYDDLVVVGSTNAATISGLAEGTAHYFAATSIDSLGNEGPFSNQAVYTVPSDAATITPLPGTAGQFSFDVSGIPGHQYVVQAPTNLVYWVCVQTNTAPFIFADTNAANLPQCYYRTYYLPP